MRKFFFFFFFFFRISFPFSTRSGVNDVILFRTSLENFCEVGEGG